jgi:hypothetical protein
MSMFNPTRRELEEESDRDGLCMAREYLKIAYAALNAIKCDTPEGTTAIDEAMMKLEEAEGIISYQWAMFGGHDLPGLDKANADIRNAADEIAMILANKQQAAE